MKKSILNLLVVLVFIGLSSVGCQSSKETNIESINSKFEHTPASAGKREEFKQFDGSRFKENIPWLGDKVIVVYEKQVLGAGGHYGKAPNEAEVKQRLSKYYGEDRIVLDVESWRMRTKQLIDPLAETHAKWYGDVLRWAHEVLPGTDVGYFGIPSIPYHPLNAPDRFMADYQQELEYLKPVLEASDSLYPSFYIYYDNPTLLTYVWGAQLYQAKAHGKPVYPFLWHRGPGSNFKNEILPDYLIQQLCSFVRSNADGFVWWSISWEKWGDAAWYDDASECFN